MEKHVLIVENATEPLKRENTSSPKFLCNGIFTEFDIENRNKRFYTAENFLPCMEALLAKKKMLGVLYGEYDHPDVFDIAGKNVSHVIENLTYNQASNRVDGSIALLSTTNGKEARAIIQDGYPIFVSSRAAGVTGGNGKVMLKELFTYDIVLDPGFSSAKMSVNESLGYKTTEDVPYRIYEMKDEHVEKLFKDNKNDGKTAMDLKFFENMLATEIAKVEHNILTKIGEGKSSPEEIKAMSERYDALNEELLQVKEYLEFLKTKMSHLISENSRLSTDNSKMLYEINENTAYSNHIATQLKNLNTYSKSIDERLNVGEKMIEYVAEHAKATILYVDDVKANVNKINEDVNNNLAFLEYVAEETYVAQRFTEAFAKSAKKEIVDTQGFLEHVASEANKDGIWLNYVAEKVDGLVGYNTMMVERLKNSTPVNENVTDTVHNMESVEDYLGIQQEREIVNNITTETTPAVEPVTNTEIPAVAENLTETPTAEIPAVEPLVNAEVVAETTPVAEVAPVTSDVVPAIAENAEDGFEVQPPAEETQPVQEVQPEAQPVEETQPVAEVQPTDMSAEMPAETDALAQPINAETPEVQPIVSADPMMALTPEIDPMAVPTTEPVVEPQVEPSMETTLLSALVKILGTDETGIVMEVTPDNTIIIQKSGSDDTVTLPKDGEEGVLGYEVIDTDVNIAEKVGDVLAEINKQKVLANQQPHFFTFLTESEVANFKALDNDSREAIMLAMNEAEYYNESDVKNIIGKTLNSRAMSYEDRLIASVPVSLKETWNTLPQDQKLMVISESKYFSLVTTSDIENFFNTRGFAKAVNGPEAILIKESNLAGNPDQLDQNYVDAFLKTIDSFNMK